MKGYSTYLKSQIIDHMLRGEPWTPPRALYLGLLTAEPMGAAYSEVSAPEYERQAIELSPSGGDDETANANDVLFPPARSAWGTVSHLGFFDAPAGGRLLYSGEREEPIEVKVNLRLHWGPGAISVLA